MERPSAEWQRAVDEQANLPEDEAWARELWPTPFIQAVESALAAFEADVKSLHSPTDDEVFAVVERVVTALNAAGEHGDIETGEREELCAYVDAVLGEAGVDVAALSSRHGLDAHAITDRWREW